MKSFKLLGLTELYMHLGKGDNKRWKPIHLLHSKLGDDYCKALLKCHLDTGCAYLSKIGTNPSTLHVVLHLNLMTFGETSVLDDAQVQEAETYLVHVINHSSKFNTFDELRVKTWKNKHALLELPPTSHSIIHRHIPRWWFLYKMFSSLISHDYDHLKPEEFGYELVDCELLARKCLNLVPDE